MVSVTNRNNIWLGQSSKLAKLAIGYECNREYCGFFYRVGLAVGNILGKTLCKKSLMTNRCHDSMGFGIGNCRDSFIYWGKHDVQSH